MKIVKFSAKVDPNKCRGDRHCERVCPSGAIRMSRRKQTAGTGENALSMPPCQNACPANVNVPGYIALIQAGRFVDAYELIRKDNPFPAVCGRICTHPCEVACGRGDDGDPLAITDLKRYVADYVYEHHQPARHADRPNNGKSVGIIGAGPSGLTCGYYLAELGYMVEIYEAHSVAGGVLAFGIPEYRQPKKILRHEINLIEQGGVTIHYSTEVGKDVSLDELREKHGAVYVATGTQFSTAIGIAGEDLDGVYHGLDFLRDVNLLKKPMVGRNVTVIGGGNTAIDASRVALRLGAEQVTILYRREIYDMPADAREVAEAVDEGVRIVPLVAPVRFIGKRRVESVECVQMEQDEFDDNDRRKSKVIKGSNFMISTDMVIPAVSQYSDLPFIDKDECKVTEWGSLVTHEDTLMTTTAGVFAGGDVVRGSDTAIRAIADGKKAAQAIDKCLGGQGILNTKEEISIPEPSNDYRWGDQKRYRMDLLDPAQRSRSFEEVVKGFDEPGARAEANRCLRCDIQRAIVDESRCVACTNCIDYCPSGAVILVERPEPLILQTDPDQVDQHQILDLCIKANLHPMQPVCPCTDTEAREIVAAIIKGAKTLEEVTLMTGARSGCGIYCTGGVINLLKAAGVEITPPENQGWYDLSTPFLRDLPDEIGNQFPSYRIHEDKEMVKQFDAMLQALKHSTK